MSAPGNIPVPGRIKSPMSAFPVPADERAFEALMRRHNSRLFRIARAILRNDAEAEEAVQDTYVAAFHHLNEFRGESQLGTWLSRIAINNSLMRLRRHKRDRNVVPFETDVDGRPLEPAAPTTDSAPVAVLRAEIRALLERRIDELPVAFRTVFVLREVEEMSVEETATCLSIPAATVRTRLFRARALLRDALARDIDRATVDVFGFAGQRCDRIVAAVLRKIVADKKSGNLTSSNRILRGEELNE
jgi:RNA polymerase sigma factor (sigma-70 family)